MENKLRRGLALLMTLIMLISCAPMDALAAIVPVSGGTQTSSGVSLKSIVKPPVATHTYIFMNGDTEFARQIVKGGESLNNPGTPDSGSPNKEFTGWRDGDNNAPVFGAVNVTETKTITYHAQFDDVYFVFFTNEKGEVMVTKKGKNGNTITTDGVTYPVGNEQTIVGWKDESGNIVTSVKLEHKDVTLTAIVANGHWITFDSQGGTYVEPAFVKGNGTTTAPAAPTRPGYTFHHWSATVGGTAFTFGQSLEQKLTLYAVWTANDNTRYTVIHWQENADDDEYSYAESETKTGTTGAQTNATAKSYTGFTAQTIAQQTIAGDGSTIVNVYYKRNEYKVQFYERKNRKWQEITSLTITAKYGANISKQWPTYNGSSTWSTNSSYYDGLQGPYQVNIETMPLNGAKFYGPNTGYGSQSAYYYVEVLPGESGVTYNGVTYKLHHTDTSPGTGYSVTKEDKYPITGFTYKEGTSNGQPYNNAKFYYTRNEYNIVYVSGGQTVNTVSKKFEESIADAGSYTPTTKPEGKEAYEFGGWYSDPTTTQAYSFTGKTMPAQNVTVYAKWNEPTVNGKAHIKVDGTDEGTTLTATYGEALNAEELKTLQNAIMDDHPGYTWRGWRTGKNGTGEPFNVDTKIYSDITLYPYYTKDGTFSVTYVSGKSNVTAPTDGKKYAEDSYADLMSPDKLVSSDGQYFLGWTDGKNTYQPRDKYQIKGDVTFTGVWGARPAGTTLTYKANGGAGADVVENLANNATVTTRPGTTFSRVGYTFKGWDTDPKGEGSIAPNTQVQVDNGNGENVLYAIWTPNTDVSYTVHYYKQGTTDKVAADTVVTGLPFDSTVTVNAINVPGYTAVAPTEQELKLDAYDKEIIFYYTVNQYGYTIEYYFDDVLQDDLTVTGTAAYESTIDYEDKCPAGYVLDKTIPDAENLPLTIGTDESANVIKVYYKKNVFTLTIKYVYEDGSEAAETHTENVEFGKGYSVTSPDVVGYTPDKLTVTGTMPASNVEVTVTYTKRSDLSYTVYYYWNGTTTPVANSKTVDKQIYNATVTESPATIGGYTAVSDETQTITIGTGENKIIFYYYKNVELTANSKLDEIYDGTVKTVSGFTGAPDDADFSAITVGAKGTDAGEYSANFAKGTVGTVDKTEKYKVTVANNGTLTINKRTVTLESKGGSKEYDGTPLTKPVVTVGGDGFVAGEVTDVKATGSVTFVHEGEVTNAITYTEGANFKGTNYTISKDEGKLSITKREGEGKTITVTAANGEKVYDGAPLTNNDFTHAGALVEGDTLTAVVEGSQTDVGVGDNVVRSYKVMRGNVDVTTSYTFTDSVKGALTVTARAVTFTGESKSLPYTGGMQSITGITQSGLVEGHRYEGLTYKAEGQNVGSYDGAFSGDVVIKDAQGNDVTKNYNVTKTPGKLTITNASFTVTFTGESAEKVYNGKEQSITGITATGLLDGHTYSGLSYEAKGKDVGIYDGAFSGEVKIEDANGANVTQNYAVTQTPGKLTITAVTDEVVVTITGHKDTVTYDGKEHPVTGYDVSISNELYKKADFTFNGTAEVKGTGANTYPMGLKAERFTNKNDNFKNVRFVVTDGELVINKRPVKVTAEKLEYAYNYANPVAHPAEGVARCTVEAANGNRGLLAGDALNADVLYDGQSTQTLIGVYQAVAQIGSAKITNANGEVTDNYAIEKVDSTLTIKGNDPLDPGKETTSVQTNYTVGDVIEYKITVKNVSRDEATNVVVTDNMAEIQPGAGYSVSDDGHTATIASIPAGGTVLVYARHTVTAEDVENAYADNANGSLTNVANIKFGDWNKDVEGHHDKLNDTYEYVVRYYWNNYTSVQPHEEKKLTARVGTVVTEEPAAIEGYTPVSEDSKKLTISADQSKNVIEFYYYKNVQLTANSETYTYDGTEKQVSDFTVKGENKDQDDQTIAADFSAITVGAKGIDAGEYPANFAENTVGTVDKTGRYIVTAANNGKLVINPVTGQLITITANSNEKTYDGTPLTDNRFDYTKGVLVEGDVLTAVVEGSATNVGDEGKNVVKSYAVKRGETDVTKNYTFGNSIDGTLTINKRKVTLKSADLSKTYDGTPLVNGETALETEDGFVSGEGATYTFTGSQTVVGSSANAFTYTLNEGTNADNYEVAKTEGTLTVTKNEKAITVTANSHTWEYDGQPHSDGGYTVNYDGKDYPVNAGGTATLPTGDVVKAKITKTVTNVSDSAANNNKIDELTIVNAADEDTKGQYETVTLIPGTLTITKRGAGENKVTITAADNTVEYDGQPHGAKRNAAGEIEVGTSFTVTNLAKGHSVKTLAIEGSETDAGVYADKLVPGNAVIVDGNGVEVTANYDITYVPGTLTITKRGAGDDKVVLTAANNTVVYDGQPHGAKLNAAGKIEAGVSYTITNLAENHSVQTVAIDGSQTAVGKYPKELVPSGAIIVDKNGNDVTANYEVSYEKGDLEITSPDTVIVTIKGKTDTVEYNGQKHEVNGYEVVSISNTLYTEADFGFADGATAHAEGTDAGDYFMNLTKDSFVNRNANFSAVTFVVVDGKLTITKRGLDEKNLVKIIAANNSVYYDGQSHGAKLNAAGQIEVNVSYTTEYLAPGHKVQSVVIDGSRTKVGLYKDELVPKSAVIVDKTDKDVTENYEITYVRGTLEIKKNETEIKVTANSYTWEYDGQAHSDGGYTVTYGNESYTVKAGESATLSTGDKVTAVVKGQVKDVDDTKAGNNEIVEWSVENRDFYNNVKAENGTLTITPRKVTLESDGGSKKYDGTPLTRPDVTIEGSFVEGEVSDIKATGSVTYVSEGEVDNLITFKKNEGFKDSNYGIEEKIGKLFIEPLDVTIIITGPSAIRGYEPGVTHTIVTGGSELDFVYDSDKVDGKIGVEGMVKGDKILPGTLKHTLEGMYVGEYEGVFTLFDSNGKKADKPTVMHDGVDVTENYKFSYKPGTLTITGDHMDGDKKVENEIPEKNYLLGQKIPFTITVRSVSKDELKDVTVTDPTATILPDRNTANPAYTVSEDEHTATITSLAPEAEVIVYAEHEVTEDDIINRYTNEATINWGNDEVKVSKTPSIEEENPEAELVKEIVLQDGQDENHKFKLGETVYFKITVTNTGNVTLNEYEVKEVLPGAAFIDGTGYTLNNDKTVATIEKMEPVKDGQEAPDSNQIVLYAQYNIKEEDLGNKELKNIVTADNSKPGEVPIPVDEAKSVSGQKIWKDEGNAFNTRPASITLTLMRKLGQNGAAEQYRTMQLGSNGSWRYSFDHLPKHDAQENEYFYWVVEEPVTGYDTAYETKDESHCDIVNNLQTYTLTIHYWQHKLGDTKMEQAFPDYVATLYYKQPYDVESPEREGIILDDMSQARISGTMPVHDLVIDVYYHRIAYRLTIHYIYQDGTMAHEDYTWTYWFNSTYNVPSPIIPGFTPSIDVIAGRMPSHGLELTVVYVGDGEIVVPDEDTSLGFKSYLNAGECFE